MATKFCQGISDISDSYSGFIIDQWGVLHNGEEPYEGVIDCLKELKGRNKYIIILSNSGKRSGENKDRLKTIGIGPSLYDQIVTSGEMTWMGLHEQSGNIFEGLGSKCYLISRGSDRSLVRDLNIEIVSDPKEATFLVISGTDAPEMEMEDYEPALKICAQRGLRAICANPDSRGVMGSALIMGPGTLARRYQDFGGVVNYIGKPHQPIFQHCIKILQDKEIYPGQTVVIGDAMAHDILGGSLVSLDTCLVRCGLHHGVFRKAVTPQDVNKALGTLMAQYNNVRPTYLVNRLEWGRALPDRKHRKRVEH